MTGGHPVVAAPLAVAAAVCFAVANVAQMHAVRRSGERTVLDYRLLAGLVKDRLWLAGLVASVAGFGLEGVALWLAPVILVQPLIVAELLFALPLAALTVGGRLGAREWAGAALVAVGLGLFVALVRPTDRRLTASGSTWVVVIALVAAVAAGLLVLAVRRRGIGRTSALAAAAGVSFGLLSVLTKAASHQFAGHGFGALVNWTPWALAAVGIVGLSLTQNAFGSGPLAVSLPLIDVGEPLVASVIAMVVFGERIQRIDIGVAIGVVVAAAIVTVGVNMLDRSPLVQAAQTRLDRTGDRSTRPPVSR